MADLSLDYGRIFHSRPSLSISFQCSVSCGGGEQRRTVWCEHSTSGKKVGDSECKVSLCPINSVFIQSIRDMLIIRSFFIQSSKPLEQRDCLLPSCPSTTLSPTNTTSILPSSSLEWSTTHWSAVRHSHRRRKGQSRILARLSNSHNYP